MFMEVRQLLGKLSVHYIYLLGEMINAWPLVVEKTGGKFTTWTEKSL